MLRELAAFLVCLTAVVCVSGEFQELHDASDVDCAAPLWGERELPVAYLNSTCGTDGTLRFFFDVPSFGLRTEPTVLEGVPCVTPGDNAREGFFVAYDQNALSGIVSIDCTYNELGCCECFFKKVKMTARKTLASWRLNSFSVRSGNSPISHGCSLLPSAHWR